MSTIRTFDTGATRDALGDKLQYEGYFSPLVLEARARYMRTHQTMADGSLREADNWQKGIPTDALMDSAFRHFMDWWKAHRGYAQRCDVQEAICALMFNAEAYLHATLAAPVFEAKTDTDLLQDFGHATASDGGVALTVAGSDEPIGVYVEPLDEPFPLPHFGPGSPAATTADGSARSYVGEDTSGPGRKLHAR